MNVKTNKLTKVLLALAFVLCVVASVFSLNTASAATEEDVMLYPGGSIRYEEPAGIRFTAFVSDSLFDNTETHDLKDGVTVGMYVVPAMYTDENVTNITSSTTGVKTVSSDDEDGFLWRKTSGIPGFQQFDVAIVNIPDTAYGEDILARAFVNDGGEVLSDTVIRSIAGVANATLAADQLVDELEDKLIEEEITALNGYIADTAEAVDAPVLSVLDGEVSWTSSASEYLVKQPNGAVLMTNATEMNVSEGAVSVVAVGDGVTSTYSAPATKTVHALGAMQLASFDDESYFEDLTPSHPNFASTAYYPVSTFVRSPAATGVGTPILRTNRADVASATADACVEIGVPITVYQAGGARFAAFTVYLQKSLNLTDYAGIKIRMNVYGSWMGDTDASVYKYYICGQDNLTQGYKGATNVGYNQLDALNTWFDWFISAEELATYYENGDSSITIMVYYGGSKGSGNGSYGIGVLLDDISYYDKLNTPTNLTLDGETLTWDAVDGAISYVVNVDGNDVATVSETSYDLTAYASASFAVKVKALGTDKADSPYSAPVNYIYKEKGVLAAFNAVAYEGSVKLVSNSVATPWTNGGQIDFSTINPPIAYETNVDGANDGDALHIQPIAAHYGSGGGARHAIFTITLDEALDLSGETYDGIVLRFKYTGVGSALGPFNRVTNPDSVAGNVWWLNLCSVATKSTGYTSYDEHKDQTVAGNDTIPSTTFTTGEWVEWKISNDVLKTLYSGGETQIAFAIGSTVSQEYNAAVVYHTYLDSLSYYKD